MMIIRSSACALIALIAAGAIADTTSGKVVQKIVLEEVDVFNDSNTIENTPMPANMFDMPQSPLEMVGSRYKLKTKDDQFIWVESWSVLVVEEEHSDDTGYKVEDCKSGRYRSRASSDC